jgi:hypothetical protein
VFFWLEIEVKLKHKEKELEDILNEKKSADTSSEGIMKKVFIYYSINQSQNTKFGRRQRDWS